MTAATPPTVPSVPFASSAEVRDFMVAETRLDLIGPGPADTALHDEKLPLVPPSRWYLGGFLVPATAPEEIRESDAQREGDLDGLADGAGADDQGENDKASAKRAWRPSSMGLSFLLELAATFVEVEVIWGDYHLVEPTAGAQGEGEASGEKDKGAQAEKRYWQRRHRAELLKLDISSDGHAEVDVPNSDGLRISYLVRGTTLATPGSSRPVKAVSTFLVNRRAVPEDKGRADEAAAFQTLLLVRSTSGFVERHDMRGFLSDDPDERIADLHFADVAEFAVGHNASAEWTIASSGVCPEVRTTWTPLAPVPRVVPNENIAGFELGMEKLGTLADANEARVALGGIVDAYRAWIAAQKSAIGGLVPRRREVAEDLLREAELAATRIESGIACLGDPKALKAFCIANRTIARAGRQRDAQIRGIKPAEVRAPRWRPFQLAFLLLNLRSVTDPTHADREKVDLLFFPTGGGKTEAYLGLAAFTITWRRICNPGLTGAGLSVLMRYTLRLLTLDQLGRASAMICALELERQSDPELGAWPIEIGLWVGRAATPNRMGHQGDGDSGHTTARWRVLDFKRGSTRNLPIPLRNCPWCGTGFEKDSFRLMGATGASDTNSPKNLTLRCVARECDFHLSKQDLPIVTVDEPIYRRLPAFMIATVDKFAAMPWNGEVASFFGGADRHDPLGFLGPWAGTGGSPLPKPLLPPDLVIQDELHLISGPLGTMVGLYETALDSLSSRGIGAARLRPKIVASTATVRRAQRQIQALFERSSTAIFPPPGPDRRDSFFAQTKPSDEPGARRYLGIAVPGGSPKVLFLRALVTVMASAGSAWRRSTADDKNPADPYMTLVGYFNALRELGAARRIVEGEVGPRLRTYGQRARIGLPPRLESREIAHDVMELTSRVSTDEVAEAKRRLGLPYATMPGRVDAALATNMISVGLDISRLGLMVVSGQPKAAAEYIQATSRVGRETGKPGLVITLLNVNKPRDRSHFERFMHWHESFYRAVEATSVTPFSPRALDRALAAVAVGLGRLSKPDFMGRTGAHKAATDRAALDNVADIIAERARNHDSTPNASVRQKLRDHVRQRTIEVLDDWAKVASDASGGGTLLHYSKGSGVSIHLLREMLDRAALPSHQKRFKAPRSLRDVEPSVLIKLKTPTGQEIDE
jgi:hypothetical protein